MDRKLDVASAEMLEEPTVRIPYELMRRNHRAAQRQVERDFTAVQTTLKGSQKSKGGTSAEDLLNNLRTAKERVTGLKRKLDHIQPSPRSDNIRTNPSASLRARAQILKDIHGLESVTGDHPDLKSFHDTRLDRYITEYLLRSGKREAASKWAEQRNIEPYVDIGLFGECARIEAALTEKHSCSEALAWCGENRGTLRKTKNDLEFHLRYQEYIELCRQRRTTDALSYVRKNLTTWAETHMMEIQAGMALMIFGEHTVVQGYRSLYDASRWETLRKQFKETFYSIYGIPSLPLLSLTIAAGLSSLKLAACLPNLPHQSPTNTTTQPPSADPSTAMTMSIPSLPSAPPVHNTDTTIDPSLPTTTDPTPIHSHPEHPQRNIDCPTCSKDMSVLAKEVPFSHHVNSTIVCRISGEIMDDENYPMAFPNGYVYSHKALRAMADENHGVMVTCPRTGQQCSYSRLRKVFVT